MLLNVVSKIFNAVQFNFRDILEVEMVPELKDSIEELKENIEMSAKITKPRTPKATNNIFVSFL